MTTPMLDIRAKRETPLGYHERGGAALHLTWPSRRALGRALLVSVLAGAVFLGAGTRVAMRGVAMVEGRVPVWTFRGTLNVVGMGAAFGLLFGLTWALVARWIPGNRFVRGLLFGALCAVIASPGLTPQRVSTFALFVPWFVAFGVAVSRFVGATDSGKHQSHESTAN